MCSANSKRNCASLRTKDVAMDHKLLSIAQVEMLVLISRTISVGDESSETLGSLIA